MKLIDLAFALIVSLMGLLTGGCSMEVGAFVRHHDTFEEKRVTTDKSWWQRIAGGQGGKTLSGE